MMLCNNNVLVLSTKKEMVKIEVEDCIHGKLDLSFSRMRYNELIMKDVGIEERGIFLMDDNGYVIYISFDKALLDLLKLSFNEPKRRAYEFLKGAQPVDLNKVQNIPLNVSKSFSPKSYKLWKCHETMVTQCILVYFEEFAIITYSIDGLVKMWSYKNNHLFFSIRLPNFIHNTWDMQMIHKKRANRNISTTVSLLNYLKETIDKGVEKPTELL